MYDIIGDIHGHAADLKKLLLKLGYNETQGVWSHESRKLISIGDLVDRGPYQRETVDIIRRMHEARHALVVMGNHEFNAVSWYYTDKQDMPLRPHTDKNRKQHSAFLHEANSEPAWYGETIAWFASLPLFIETESLCCVHAAWGSDQIRYFESVLDSNFAIKPEDWVSANTQGHPLYDAIEYCLKGPELDLPAGTSFLDGGGNERNKIRVKWWNIDENSTYANAAVSVPENAKLPEDKLPKSIIKTVQKKKPLFFGHYWMTGKPHLLTPTIACLDWSVVKENGCLAAYRFDGEKTLSNDKWFWV